MPQDTEQPAILVTGGSGFLGHHLTAALTARGQAVRILDFAPSRHQAPLVSCWQGSFLDMPLLRQAMVGVDTVYHLAATTFPREAHKNPRRDAEENLVGTLDLLELAAQAGVRRVIFCSSGGTVYGPDAPVPLHEDLPTNPISAYGIHKLGVEKYLRMFHHEGAFESLSLRIANPYGPFQDVRKAQGALSTFCQQALRDDEIQIWGDGSVERDFIHVTDVARALVLAGASRQSGTEINIGSGHGTTLNDLLRLIGDALGRPVRHRYLPGRAFDVPRNVLDIAKADRLLAWAPQIALADGIRGLLSAPAEGR